MSAMPVVVMMAGRLGGVVVLADGEDPHDTNRNEDGALVSWRQASTATSTKVPGVLPLQTLTDRIGSIVDSATHKSSAASSRSKP